jgi:hypothetical protein
LGETENPDSDIAIAVVVKELKGFSKLLNLFHGKFGHSKTKKNKNGLA